MGPQTNLPLHEGSFSFIQGSFSLLPSPSARGFPINSREDFESDIEMEEMNSSSWVLILANFEKGQFSAHVESPY